MAIRRGNVIRPFTRWPQLVIMDTIYQVLCGHGLVILWDSDRPGNFESMRDQCRRNGDYSLNGNIATFALIVQLAIPCRRREVRIEVRVTQTPTPCSKVIGKPGVCRWVRDTVTSSRIRFIEQVNIGNMSSCYPSPRKSENAIVPNETTCGP